MKPFMGADFLLTTKIARQLYHEAAAEEPVFDYHCHLDPGEIAADRRFDNLTELWLGGDHYKWRAMRSNGVPEELITGKADPYDKFLAWAGTVPRLIGNPLYHWTHLELRRYFGITEPLNLDSAKTIWKAANAALAANPALSVYGIFKMFNVYALGTTDDPADYLEWHRRIKAEGKTAAAVLPSFRPDRAIHLEKGDFAAYIAALGEAAGKRIASLGDLLEVLRSRIGHFHRMGCRAADHALEYVPRGPGGKAGADTGDAYCLGGAWEREAGETFEAALAGNFGAGMDAAARARALDSYKGFLLRFLGANYADRGWVMELHLQSLRDVNSRMLADLGANAGYDVSFDHRQAEGLAEFLDFLESRDKLPKTILFTLNPRDYYSLGTIMGAFQRGAAEASGLPGKMQLGSAWWFCDHRDGMEEQMRILGNLGCLAGFTGMLTDSRSFLSYPRHEYFRRILCGLLGRWAEEGEIPHDEALLTGMVRDISFRNAKAFFEGSPAS